MLALALFLQEVDDTLIHFHVSSFATFGACETIHHMADLDAEHEAIDAMACVRRSVDLAAVK